MVLLKQMMILFVLMAIGILCRKIKIMNDAVSKGMSAIVVNIASPAFILSAGINRDEYVEPQKLILCVFLSALMYAVLILIATVLPKILRIEGSHVGTYRIMTIFSNIGFMGFPIVLATYGKVGLLYAAIFQFPYNLLIYTYGIHVIKAGRDGVKAEKFQLRKIINVGVVSVFLSITLYLLKVRVPDSIESVVTSLSGLTIPLSMMVIGYSLGGMKIKELVSDVKLMLFSAIKLIIIPCFAILILKFFLKDPTLLGVCFIMIATPVGSMTAMFAEAYDGDKETASKGVALTTLLSVITIPLVGYILGL